MALKARIPESEFVLLSSVIKDHYVKQDDGSYRLDVPDAEDAYARGLKSALEKERESVKAAEKKAAELRAEIDRFKDIDPERAREALKKLADIDDKTLLDAGKFDELFSKRYEQRDKEWDSRLKAVSGDLTKTQEENKALLSRLERTMVDQGVMLAASKANVRPGALGDVIRRAREVWRLDGERALPYKGDGSVIYGKNAQEPMTMDEWVQQLSLSDDGRHLFEGNKGAGVVPGQRNINGQNVIVLSREEARNPARYREAQEQATKNGMEFRIATD